MLGVPVPLQPPLPFATGCYVTQNCLCDSLLNTDESSTKTDLKWNIFSRVNFKPFLQW